MKNHPHYKSELQGENRGRGVAMGYWGNAGLETSSSASVNADGFGEPGARLRRHRRLPPRTRDAAGRDAGHHGRGSLAPRRRHRQRRLQPLHRGQPHRLRRRLGGLRARHGDSQADGRSAPPRSGSAPRTRSPTATTASSAARRTAEGKDRQFTFKELAGQLGRTGGTIDVGVNINKSSVGPGLRRPHRRRRSRPRHRQGAGSSATRPSRTSVPRFTPATSRVRSRAASPRVSAWR